MIDGESTLKGPVVFEGGPFGVAVRVARRNVEVVEGLRLLDEVGPWAVASGEVLEESGDHVAPGFLAEVEVEGLDGLLRCLLGGEARPFVATGALGIRGVLQIAFRLPQPVIRPVRHGPFADLI